MDGDLIHFYEKHGIMSQDTIYTVEAAVKTFYEKLHYLQYYYYDIKPDNILFKQTPQGLEIAVGDFGLISNRLVFNGTPGYTSPKLFMMHNKDINAFKDEVNRSRMFGEFEATKLWEFAEKNTTSNPHEALVWNDLYALYITLYMLSSKQTSVVEYLTKKFADDTIQLAIYNLDKYLMKFRVRLDDLMDNGTTFNVKKVSDQSWANALASLNGKSRDDILAIFQRLQQGGIHMRSHIQMRKTKKTFKVYYDKQSKKYIIQNRKRVYLSDIRGQFTYV